MMILKRLFDIIVSVLGLLILWPVLILIAVLIKSDSRGPVFYRPWRTGKDYKRFKIFKFRTMVENADKMGGPSTAFEDVRFTKIGKFLRRAKLDELPQFINILRGEMSVVGPRPQIEEYTRLYEGENKLIVSVRPGLTDYASIEYINLDKLLGNENVDLKYLRDIEPRKNELRLKYVKERTFWIDMKIIFWTLYKLAGFKNLWR